MRFRFLFIICVLLAPDYAAAQGCSNAEGAALYRNPNAWAAWCRACGGRVVPTRSNPECHLPGGGGGFAPPDPLQSNLWQFNDFVRRAASYVPNGNVFLNASSPSSIGELEQRLQSLYDGLYREEQRWRMRVQWAREDEAIDERRWRKLEDEFNYLRDNAPIRLQQTSQYQAQAIEFERQTGEIARARYVLNLEAKYWSDIAERDRFDVVKWIRVVIPDRYLKVERDVLMSTPVPAGLGTVKPGPVYPLADAAAASLPSALFLPPSVRDAITTPAPPLQGDIPLRIATALQIPPRLDALANEVNAHRSRIQQREKAVAYMEKRNPELRADMARANDAETRIAKARESLGRAQRELDAAKESYAYRVSEALLWQLAKEKVVKPGLRNLAREKMWFGNLDSLTNAQVDELFAKGQKAWNGWFVWRGQENFVEVQDKALALIQQNKDFISEAARVIATGSPAEIQAFADWVFVRLEANTTDIAKTALRDLTGFAPLDQISHRLAGFR